MKLNPTHTHHELAPALSRLAGLRRTIRRAMIARAMGLLALGLTCAVALTLAIDWYFRLDRAQRGIILLLAVGASIYGLYRWLIRPMTRPISDRELALRVESACPALAQSLITAIELCEITPRTHADDVQAGPSPALTRRAIETGITRAAAADFGRALNPGFLGRARRAIILGAAAALLLVVAFTTPSTRSTMLTWFSRNVMISDVRWPQLTRLEVVGLTDNRITLPRGDDWELAVRALGKVPGHVYLEIDPDSGGKSFSQDLAQVGADGFRATLRNLLEPFHFRLTGGDDQTPWLSASLVDRPAIATIALTATPPNYTGLPVQSLSGEQAGLDVLRGSSLAMRITATKPLASAQLYLGDREIGPMTKNSDGSFAASIAPDQLKSGSYGIRLVDQTGLASRSIQRLSVRLIADRQPVVRATLHGISSLATPVADLPIRCRFTDDYGIASAALVYTVGGGAATQPDAPRSWAVTDLASKLPARDVSHDVRFGLSPLKLTPGQTLAFKIEATDNNTANGPTVGQSAAMFLRIVTEQELRAELVRREQEQRQEFALIVREQDDILTATRSAQVALPDEPDLSDAGRATLTQLERRQRSVAQRCRTVVQRFAAINEEVVNNHLEATGGPIERRLIGQIISPLNDLVAGPMPQSGDLLETARKPTVELPQRQAMILEAIAQQQRSLATMRKIMAAMEKWEGYQEAVNAVFDVLKAQEQVNQDTKKAMEDRIKGIFGDQP